MKYYVYVSDAKIDMLYPQIPTPLLKRIASSLNIDLKLFGAEISIGSKSDSSVETRYAKAQIVSEYIEKHLDVGSINAPSTYFKSSMPMQWGPLQMRSPGNFALSEAVYFGGFNNQTIVGLAGSLHHVVGFKGAGEANTLPASALVAILNYLDRDGMPLKPPSGIEKKPVRNEEQMALYAVADQTSNLVGPKQHLEFLAKTLLQGPLPPHEPPFTFHNFPNFTGGSPYVILGTPIYVAVAD